MGPEDRRWPKGPPRAEHDVSEVLALLVRSVTDYAIFALDVEGRVTSWNAGAERLKGYRPAEIIGQHFSVFYPPADRDARKPDRELAIAVADGHFEDEGWRLRKDGTLFWANVVITALRGPDGRLLGFGKVTRDMTERKRGEDALRESEERFRLLVHGVLDYAIFLLEPDGTVANWNLGAERLKGYRTEEIVGQDFSRFYTDEDRRLGLPQRALAHAREHGRWENEGWRLRRDGTRFWANVVITALTGSDGRLRGFAKVTRDLTERKRTEDALRGVLERERESAAMLREVDQMRSDLLTVIAHDLRGPVGIIQGLLDVVRSEWSTTSDAEKLELLDRTAARAAILVALVDDVFDLVRLDAGQLPVDAVPLDLPAILAQVVADVRMGAAPRRITTKIDAHAVGLGDPRRIWQVLSNLLSNAVKYSAPGAAIDITVERSGSEVVVAVTDCGEGIPADQQHLLFTRFSRLPQSDAIRGSGIGLFIAKSMIEAQGGRIEVESAPGEGSTFRVSLPAAP